MGSRITVESHVVGIVVALVVGAGMERSNRKPTLPSVSGNYYNDSRRTTSGGEGVNMPEILDSSSDTSDSGNGSSASCSDYDAEVDDSLPPL